VTLKIGTRASRLARWQAEWVRARLEATNPDLRAELVPIHTRGDAILDRPLSQVGGKGLFVKELEEALYDGRIDLAVHSLKDMPSELPAGLVLGAVPPRGNAFDAWVRPAGAAPLALDALAPGAVVGTSSLRRRSQILLRRPDLEVISLRGNVETRLRKLDEGEGGLDAIVLACAGLERLGLGHRVTATLPPGIMLPAVGQGALAIEHREGDAEVEAALDTLDDADTRDAITAERALLRTLEGSCQIPLAGWATLSDGFVVLEALVADPDGREVVRRVARGPRVEARALGVSLAETLLSAGGRGILERLGPT